MGTKHTQTKHTQKRKHTHTHLKRQSHDQHGAGRRGRSQGHKSTQLVRGHLLTTLLASTSHASHQRHHPSPGGANRASSVFKVQGYLGRVQYNDLCSAEVVASSRLACLGQIVRVQCSGFRVSWEELIGARPKLSTRLDSLALGKSCEFRVQGEFNFKPSTSPAP
jgi:hypothetical protein